MMQILANIKRDLGASSAERSAGRYHSTLGALYAWCPMHQDAVEVKKPGDNLPCLLTGYVFTCGLFPQYYKFMDLHVGERHNGFSL